MLIPEGVLRLAGSGPETPQCTEWPTVPKNDLMRDVPGMEPERLCSLSVPMDADVCTQEPMNTSAHEWWVHHLLHSLLSTCPWRLLCITWGGHLQPQDTILYKQITDWLLFLLMDTQVVSSLQRQDPQGDACLPLGEPMTVSCCICLVTPSRLARSKWTWVQDAHRCCQRPSKDAHHAFPSLLSIQWMLLLFLKQW